MARRTSKSRPIWAAVHSVALPATGMIVIAFFGGYALFGANGVLAWGDYSKRLEVRRATLVTIERERDRLAHRVRLLDGAHADPDLADELVRRDLGVVRSDEILVPLR